MSLAAGARLGPYEILSPLGAGGMGEVYRARDAKLNRDVALKILPQAFAADPDRLARFQREAQVLASLNHPHIGQIYGFEDQDGIAHALVLELIDGPTLADRLAGGPLPIAEALSIARQMADALEAAHEQGIVHRDLKPGNIKIKDDGTVKVLDFGLAKALVSGASSQAAEAMNTPTITAHATEVGVILGTAAYMAPEQARGQAVDRRADIWAFGAVVYEMLSGRRAFSGESRSDTLAAVLRQDVNWAALPAGTPASVRRLIARCLDRDAKQRLRDIGEARIVLDDPSATVSAASARPQRRSAGPVAIAVVATAALLGTAWYISRTPASPPAVTRFMFSLPEGHTFTGRGGRFLTMSPDGTQIAYVADGGLHLRSVSELDTRQIQGTDRFEVVAEPVFSPDSQSIAFYAVADQTLKRIALTGGGAVTIATTDLPPAGMSWGPDGIVYSRGGRQIMRVSPDGGTPEALVTVKDDESIFGPQLLPGGRHVLFTLATGTAVDRWSTAQLVVQSLATNERRTIIEGGSDGRYVSTGHLVYALDGRLLAVAFDPQRLEVHGGPVPMVNGVRRPPTSGAAEYTVSESGGLAYISGPASGSGQVDIALTGRTQGVQLLGLPGGSYSVPRVSPDGTRVAFGNDIGKESSVWIHALSGTSAMRRATFGGNNQFPIWTSDSKRIAFQSDRDGDLAIFWQSADGTGSAERLTKPEPETSHIAESWSPNGERFLFSVTKGSDVSLWMFSLKDRTTTPFGGVHSSMLTNAIFSPDGRWVAYASTEPGKPTMTFVQPFPTTGARYQLGGGVATQPLWSRDGTQLFYNPRPGAIASVSVTAQPTFAFGNPVVTPRPFQTGPPGVRRPFDLAPDGKFVGLVAAGENADLIRQMDTQIRVVLNWFEELKRKAPH